MDDVITLAVAFLQPRIPEDPIIRNGTSSERASRKRGQTFLRRSTPFETLSNLDIPDALTSQTGPYASLNHHLLRLKGHNDGKQQLTPLQSGMRAPQE